MEGGEVGVRGYVGGATARTGGRGCGQQAGGGAAAATEGWTWREVEPARRPKRAPGS